MKNLLFAFVLLISSCASIPKEENVPKEMEVIDLIQKAQEAFEINNYRGAKKWYEIILHRFGDDSSVRVEAEYELAHILVKQKKWKQAHQHLSLLIKVYESKDGRRLPPEFYKLAKMDYEKVVKKLSPSYLESLTKREAIKTGDELQEQNGEGVNHKTFATDDANEGFTSDNPAEEISLEETDDNVQEETE